MIGFVCMSDIGNPPPSIINKGVVLFFMFIDSFSFPSSTRELFSESVGMFRVGVVDVDSIRTSSHGSFSKGGER